MTKMRETDSFEEAAFDVVRMLGAKEAAAIAGLAPQTIRDYTDADRPGRPAIQTALLLDAACYERTGRAPFFESLSRQLAARTQTEPRKVGDILEEALDLPGAVGRLLDLIRRSRNAVTSGAGLTPSEGGAIMKAIKVQRRELDDVEAAVAAATNDPRKSTPREENPNPANPAE
jgi:hypothetical protein